MRAERKMPAHVMESITSHAVRSGAARLAVFAALGLLGTAGQAQDTKSTATGVRNSIALSAEDREAIIRRVLAHPDVTTQAPGHRLVGIRATAGTADGPAAASAIFTVVLFDHTALEARRVQIDAASGRILRNDRLPGRPQSSPASSPAEVEDAIGIVRRDDDLARQLDAGAVLDGGFIVDDPAGSRRRMLQFKMMTADRRSSIRTITVDLTRREIAADAGAPQPGSVR
jgi:hypothetical protein